MPRIFPVYFFTGDDVFRMRESVDKLKRALLGDKKSEALNFHVYDARKDDIREVLDVLRSVPFASAKRLVWLRNVDSAADKTQRALVEYAVNPSKSACLVLGSDRVQQKGPFYEEIRMHAREVSFVLPKAERITEWVQKEFRERGKIIHLPAARLLKELGKDDINGLRNEIDKLTAYSGRRNVITTEDVEELVGRSPSRGVFDFVNALSRKDAKTALDISRGLYRTKKGIPEILGMVGWQFRRIKKAREMFAKGATDESVSAQCKIPPFFMQRFMKEIKSFSLPELDRNIDYLLETDYSVKRGLSKPEEALELLIVRICSAGE